jgi:hypothetical protein
MRSGVMAEFDSPEALERAYDRLEDAGYTRLESWTPYGVRGLVKRLPPSLVPWIMLGAGLFGAGFGYVVQWWCNARDFPIDVGGRPFNSAPAFIPITFESGVLFASVTGFFAMLAFCGFPRLHHPVFAIEGFERASVDRFWIGIDEADPRFDDRLPAQLAELGALRCERVAGGQGG